MDLKNLLIFYSALTVFGCVSLPDPFNRDNCTYYGVHQGESVGPVREEIELGTSIIQAICGSYTKRQGRNFVGCVKSNSDGTTTVYYQQGDRAARNHEIAHTVCGPQHTGQYHREVMNKHPRPYYGN